MLLSHLCLQSSTRRSHWDNSLFLPVAEKILTVLICFLLTCFQTFLISRAISVTLEGSQQSFCLTYISISENSIINRFYLFSLPPIKEKNTCLRRRLGFLSRLWYFIWGKFPNVWQLALTPGLADGFHKLHSCLFMFWWRFWPCLDPPPHFVSGASLTGS